MVAPQNEILVLTKCVRTPTDKRRELYRDSFLKTSQEAALKYSPTERDIEDGKTSNDIVKMSLVTEYRVFWVCASITPSQKCD